MVRIRFVLVFIALLSFVGARLSGLNFNLSHALGHSRASVTEGYIHKIDTALVSAANRIAQHIDAAMTGRKSDKVVKLRTA